MRIVLGRLYPLAIIASLALAFFYPLVLHPSEVLYSDHSDFLVKHIPAKRYLVREWSEHGELPLWWPYTSGGAPFVHDIEVEAFYPPHLVLYFITESRVGTVLSWLVVFHVAIAGWSMYAYARCQGLRAGALVAAIGYMFAGRWLLHLLDGGHYSLVGLGWLPLLLLLLEEAVRRGSLLRATGAGVVSALIILGTQPQWTFYAGLLTVAWTLGTALDESGWLGGQVQRCRLARVLLRWASCGVCAAGVGLALSAIQLLPTAEAASQSLRGASGVGSHELLMGGVRSLLFLIGPALTDDPPQLAWEDRGGLTFLWLLAAALAPFAGPPRVRYRAAVAGALLIYGLGGAYLVQGLPVFRLFRQPARALTLLNFPVAVLAGYTTEALFSADTGTALRRRGRRLLTSLCVALLILAGGLALRLFAEGRTPLWRYYWLSLAVTVPAAFWLLRPQAARHGTLLWGLLLTVDLAALVTPLSATRPELEVFAPPSLIRALTPPGRVFDHVGPTSNSPLGSGAPLARLYGVESLRGFDPLDNLRYKEYLQFIGGRDGPLRPFEGPLAFPIMGDLEIRNKPLLDLLGVRYLLQPSDLPIEDADWSPLAREEQPAAFDCCCREGGRQPLPPYTAYENRTVFPRAFVVEAARPLPPRDEVLAALTAADLRHEVLLEGDGVVTEGCVTAETQAAKVTDCQPNRITVSVDGAPAGWLVLADIWHPGWHATIDEVEVPMRRADFLFRAVRLPKGSHEVVFTFMPDSYRRGRLISLTTIALLAGGLFAAMIGRIRPPAASSSAPS
jgi:hypothetical protein